MKRPSKATQVASALSALGHEARLSVYRLLVRAGHDGLNIGQLCQLLDMHPSTLTYHLRALVQADLVVQEKRGKEVLNRPDFNSMTETIAYLTEECCKGVYLEATAA